MAKRLNADAFVTEAECNVRSGSNFRWMISTILGVTSLLLLASFVGYRMNKKEIATVLEDLGVSELQSGASLRSLEKDVVRINGDVGKHMARVEVRSVNVDQELARMTTSQAKMQGDIEDIKLRQAAGQQEILAAINSLKE